MLIHPSRETRYGMVALGPKGEYLHSRYLHTKFSQYDNNSRVPTCLRVQFTFSASVTVLTTTSVPGFTKNNCNNPSSESHTWPACDTKQLSKFQSKKNMKTNSQQSFLFRFKFRSKQFPLPTQSRSSPLTYYMLCSNTSTTAAQTTDATWCIWEIKTNVPKQAVSTCHFSQSVVNQQSQHQVPPCLQCHDGSYLSLSLSTPVPILPGKTTMLQASISRSPVQTSVKPHCSCTLPNLRCSTTHVLSHTCGNTILSWTKVTDKAQSDPPGSHATVSLSYCHLQAWRQAQ